MSAPNVFAIMPVRDYADVVADTLACASPWVRRIFVLDNGSIDGTADIVRQCARDLDNVEFLGVDERPWSYAFYALVYQGAKLHAKPGDWWYRLDADEFLVEDPRPTLGCVEPPYDTVWGSFYNYYLTPSDLTAYEAGPDAWLAMPLTERIRWYRNDWAEPRFVRHTRFMRWNDTGWREGAFNVAPSMVPIRQYRYRSPAQIEHRLALRALKSEWAYETSEYQRQFEKPLFPDPPAGAPAWHRMIADPETLDFDDGGALRQRPEFLPTVPTLHSAPRRFLSKIAAATPVYQYLVAMRASRQTAPPVAS